MFPPSSKKELEQSGIEQLDVIIVSGDAYIDHPSFGAAVIVRLLQSLGLTVGIIPQPNWRDDGRDFKKLGAPKLFFGISPGSMDSMINHYTANKRKRSDDAYTPGGVAGFRPDYPTIVYTQKLKEYFPDVPVLIGGIEASLRRVTHYDYWQDKLLPSILKLSGADILVYGMGESPMTEIVNLLKRGVPFSSLKTVPQTAVLIDSSEKIPKNKKWEDFELFSYDECIRDKVKHAKNFKEIEVESNRYQSMKRFIQRIGDQTLLVNPPYPPLTTEEIDRSFDMPFTRLPHPRYKNKPPIPAYEMIKNSINIHRGCFGGCGFCTISAHQGKFISCRSKRSIIEEVKKVVAMPGFKGTLSDLGGPSANMYGLHGKDLEKCKKCLRPTCLFPKVCPNLDNDPTALLDLYREVRKIPGIKHIFIGSGIRYDIFMDEKGFFSDKHKEYFEEVVRHHVSGRFKVAPEHTSPEVLKHMRKPSFELFKSLTLEFKKTCAKYHLNQEVIPYFISSHPGCKDCDMAKLAIDTGSLGYRLKQIQDFTPTPMTLSTTKFYTGIDPYTLKPVYTAISKDDKLRQRRFFFWYLPENLNWVRNKFKEFKLLDQAAKLFGGHRSVR